MFTTKSLLANLLKTIAEAPEIKHIVYYPDLHCDPDDEKAELVSTAVEKAFTDSGRLLYPFNKLLRESGEREFLDYRWFRDALMMFCFV